MKNGLLRYLLPLGLPLGLTMSLLASTAQAQPVGTLDLATITPGDGLYRRVLGASGNGAYGVPVAGGHDMDNDGHADYAFSAQTAGVGLGVTFGRDNAGQVWLVFGDSLISGQLDTASAPNTILSIIGDQVKENAGSEIWMDDVTGDGIGDLLICRQNFSPGGTRIGAGALTLLPGGADLRTLATDGTTLDLRTPPPSLPVVNIHGATTGSRLCIWTRTGDVTGDGINDIVVAADQAADGANAHSGEVYVIRGGAHLASSKTIDLASFGSVEVGNIARIRTPANSAHYHLGGTVQVADLDGNGKAEVLAAAALNRIGASLAPSGGTAHGSGGSPDGTVYIAWDDNFTGNWIPAPDFRIGGGPGSFTTIHGAAANGSFGEELLGGLDYDQDCQADLFVGDLVSDGWGIYNNGTNSGTGHVIYKVASLKGLSFGLDNPPPGFTMATFVGPSTGAIAGDTAMHGDFNGDGMADLAFSSPKDTPPIPNHTGAGTLHIVLGQNGVFPPVSSLKPSTYVSSGVKVFEIYGAEGNGGGSVGDVLAYSGAEGDLNGDGITDLIVNEMQGDGSVLNDVGNLLLIDSARLFGVDTLFSDGFESCN